ncbi:hypothetical protein ACP8HZ_04025 [Francisella noatunensis]
MSEFSIFAQNIAPLGLTSNSKYSLGVSDPVLQIPQKLLVNTVQNYYLYSCCSLYIDYSNTQIEYEVFITCL